MSASTQQTDKHKPPEAKKEAVRLGFLPRTTLGINEQLKIPKLHKLQQFKKMRLKLKRQTNQQIQINLPKINTSHLPVCRFAKKNMSHLPTFQVNFRRKPSF